MSRPAPLSAFEPADPLSTLCKAAGDPLRLNIVRALHNHSFGVLELAQIFAIGQSGMSHHLKVLAQAGLVATRREGNAVFYRRALASPEHPGGALHAALLQEVDSQPLATALREGITQVHRQRAAASRDFFTRSGERLQAQQELIAGLAQYRDSLLTLLDSLDFGQHASALEIGPGDGGFLPELARRFAQVCALDNSPAMLELARLRCQQDGLRNVHLQLADALLDPYPGADCVILNMVLHHFAAPAQALAKLANQVNRGGSLLITELCRHDQSWAHDTCGDLWLGFEQHELTHWGICAGLTPGESLYLGLRNGFQIQVRHFQRNTDVAHPPQRPSLTGMP
jgi:SAM-dependent methyltransferase